MVEPVKPAHKAVLALAAVTIVAAAAAHAGRKGGPVLRDLGKLVPTFRGRVQEMLARLTARGFVPLVWETYRTPERAKMLATPRPGQTRAPGVEHSMHELGLAVDVVDKVRLWEAPDFFVALGEEAERGGLTWGGRFKNANGTEGRDPPHVQAIPFALQARARLLSTPEQRDALVREALRIA
jgi:hypothetical protein